MTKTQLENHRQLVVKLRHLKTSLECMQAIRTTSPDGQQTEKEDSTLSAIAKDVEAAETAVAASEPEVKAYISTIADKETRLAMCLRFIVGLEWGEIANTAGKASADAIRRSVFMYTYRHCREDA